MNKETRNDGPVVALSVGLVATLAVYFILAAALSSLSFSDWTVPARTFMVLVPCVVFFRSLHKGPVRLDRHGKDN